MKGTIDLYKEVGVGINNIAEMFNVSPSIISAIKKNRLRRSG